MSTLSEKCEQRKAEAQAIAEKYNAGIEEAKKLPKMPISEKEFELKDALIRQTILNNGQQLETQQEQLNKIEDKIDKIDTRLYNLNK